LADNVNPLALKDVCSMTTTFSASNVQSDGWVILNPSLLQSTKWLMDLKEIKLEVQVTGWYNMAMNLRVL